MDVMRAVEEVMASGLNLVENMDEIVDMVRGMASGYGEPEAGWFMGDVLNEVNEREMALEG